MNALGGLMIAAGYVVMVVAGLWGMFLCLGIISDAVGFFGLVVSLMIAPITFFAAPFYAGFEHGNWFPLMLNYGGMITTMILIGVGSALSKNA